MILINHPHETANISFGRVLFTLEYSMFFIFALYCSFQIYLITRIYQNFLKPVADNNYTIASSF